MELKEAHVQTDAGILPCDWKVGALRDLVMLIPGGIYGLESLKDGLLPCRVATTAHIDMSDTWNKKEMGVRYFSSEQLSKYMPKNGDLVVVKSSGSAEKIQSGKIGYIDKRNERQFVFSNFLMLLRPTKVEPMFLYFYLCSNNVKRELPNLVEASTYPNIRINEYLELPIPIPPKAEQHAIATALSDVDGLIAGLEGLLAKKRALKQGAMQQLLSGQKRLPGFTGEWGVKTMGQLGHTYGGLTAKTKADFGIGEAQYIPFMNIMQGPVIDVGFLERVRIGAQETQNRARKGDLFFNGSSETPEEVGMCSVLQEDIADLYLNSFSFGFRLNKEMKADAMFLSSWFRSPEGRHVIYSSAQGATRYNIAKSNFMKLEVPYPQPEEQTAIATVLSDMDAELAALEAKLGKTRLLKQGMMQELLTGRTRLM